MLWFWVVVLVAVIGAIAVVAAGRGDSMAEVYDDRPDSTLPTGRTLTADDLRAVRFNTGVRGYRMDEVDAFMARLEAEALGREERDDPQAQQEREPVAVAGSDDRAVLDLIRDGTPADGTAVGAAADPVDASASDVSDPRDPADAVPGEGDRPDADEQSAEPESGGDGAAVADQPPPNPP